MKPLQKNTASLLYQQLYDAILSSINAKEYLPGEKIPTEDQLVSMYGVSRITVRSAIQKLCDDHILIKKHGRGTFVSMPVYVESLCAQGSFTKSCLQMGKTPSTSILFQGIEQANSSIASHLGLEEGDSVIYLRRLRSVDNQATILEEDYFHTRFDFLLKQQLNQQSLLDIIRDNTGYVAACFDDEIDIVYASKQQAEWLNCAIKTPLLHVHQLVMGEKNQVLYYNEQFIRSDIYKFTVRSLNQK